MGVGQHTYGIWPIFRGMNIHWKWGFSMAMLNNQMVYLVYFWDDPKGVQSWSLQKLCWGVFLTTFPKSWGLFPPSDPSMVLACTGTIFALLPSFTECCPLLHFAMWNMRKTQQESCWLPEILPVLTYTVESKPNKLLVLLRSQLLNL